MRTNKFLASMAAQALALAATVMMSLALGACSSDNDDDNGGTTPQESVITLTAKIAVGESVMLYFAETDKPEVTGADETGSEIVGYGGTTWLKKTYKLKAQTFTLKGTITKLNCEDTALDALNASRFPLLTYLECSDNSFTTLDVSGCTQLKTLRCTSNSLTALDVSGCTQLTNLNCAGNSLTALDVSQNTQLKELFCNNNCLTYDKLSLPTVSGGTLRYKGGIIDMQTLTPEQVKAIKKKGWTVKHYNGSNWADYPGELPTITLTTAKAVDESVTLYFAETDKPEVTGADETASETIANGDGTKYLKKTYTLTARSLTVKGTLTEFYCAGNQLTALDVNGCPQLTGLGCGENQLTALDVSRNTQLKLLLCNSNQLTALNVSGCTQLETLYCNDNQLTALNVSGCPQLTIIDCNDNQLTALDVSGCPQLTIIGCNGNQLTYAKLSLPTVSGGILYYKRFYEAQTLTPAQVNAIKKKGWTVKWNDGNYWEDYAGE